MKLKKLYNKNFFNFYDSGNYSHLSLPLLVSAERSYSLAAEYGCFAVYNFIRKSRAERAFQSYQMEKEFKDKLEFRLGVMPFGGVKIGFIYSF